MTPLSHDTVQYCTFYCLHTSITHKSKHKDMIKYNRPAGIAPVAGSNPASLTVNPQNLCNSVQMLG